MGNVLKRRADILEAVRESVRGHPDGPLPHAIYLAARKRPTLRFRGGQEMVGQEGGQETLAAVGGAGQPGTGLTLRVGAGHESFSVGSREFERLRAGRDEVTVHVSIAFEEIYATPPRVLIISPMGGSVTLRDDDVGQGGFLATMTLDRAWPSPSYSFEWLSVGV